MADNKKELKIKEQKEKEVKIGGVDYQIKWAAQTVEVDKYEEGGTGDLEIEFKKKTDTNWGPKTKVKIDYVKGFWSHGGKIKKDTQIDNKNLEADVSLGIKGFKTAGWITMIVIVIAVLALIAGLWYWMTRKSPEDEE